jgi:hypothetical protein
MYINSKLVVIAGSLMLSPYTFASDCAFQDGNCPEAHAAAAAEAPAAAAVLPESAVL